MERMLRRSLDLNPDAVELRFLLAVALESRGRIEESIKQAEQVVKQNPNMPDALNFLAYSYVINNRNLERAKELSLRSLDLKPEEGAYLDTLGVIYFALNQLSQAEEALDRAVKKNANDPIIVEHYAKVLVAMKKIEQAKRVLGSIVKLELSEKQRDDEESVRAFKRCAELLEEL
jgi:predicted Zn-dependent protease